MGNKIEARIEKFLCPCCGNYTLEEKPPGTYEVCSTCGWEDDDVQFYEPDFEGGANILSLNQAKAAYRLATVGKGP
jgi:predicted RNA-binding Zn-ribbon protein involved in translation (DUF1610 family)